MHFYTSGCVFNPLTSIAVLLISMMKLQQQEWDIRKPHTVHSKAIRDRPKTKAPLY